MKSERFRGVAGAIARSRSVAKYEATVDPLPLDPVAPLKAGNLRLELALAYAELGAYADAAVNAAAAESHYDLAYGAEAVIGGRAQEYREAASSARRLFRAFRSHTTKRELARAHDRHEIIMQDALLGRI